MPTSARTAKSRGTRWGRVFAGLFFVVVATFVAAYYLPLYRAHQKLAEQYRELGQRSQGLSESVTKMQAELKTASEARDQLQADHDLRESARKTTGDQQERVEAALSSKLDKFMKKGNAALLVSAGSLFVAFDSALLVSAPKARPDADRSRAFVRRRQDQRGQGADGARFTRRRCGRSAGAGR